LKRSSRQACRFEVVPGISSALAVPAYAGIPLTHRGMSSSVAVITGARGGDGAYESGAFVPPASADTVVVLMGVAHLREIADDLVNSGVRWKRRRPLFVGALTTGTNRYWHAWLDALEAERPACVLPQSSLLVRLSDCGERLNWFEQNLNVVDEEELEATFAVAC